MGKTWLEEIATKNAAYVQTPEAGQYTKQLLPGDRVLFTCMDPRVRVEGIGGEGPNEDGVYTRVVRTPGGKPDYKAAFILCYLANMREFAIMLHTDCGQTKIFDDPDSKIERMKERLSEEEFERAKALIGEPLRDKLRNWLDVFDDPYEEVRRQVETFKNHPLTPPDIIVHGLVQDIFTGEVEVVINGYEGA
jgi:carbonic anhydrase